MASSSSSISAESCASAGRPWWSASSPSSASSVGGLDRSALLEPCVDGVAVRDGGQPRPRSRMSRAADRGLPERILHRLAQLIDGDQQALGPEDRRDVPGGQLHERDLELLVGDRLLDPLRLTALPAACLRLVLDPRVVSRARVGDDAAGGLAHPTFQVLTKRPGADRAAVRLQDPPLANVWIGTPGSSPLPLPRPPTAVASREVSQRSTARGRSRHVEARARRAGRGRGRRCARRGCAPGPDLPAARGQYPPL
jgi:hypothetical protein